MKKIIIPISAILLTHFGFGQNVERNIIDHFLGTVFADRVPVISDTDSLEFPYSPVAEFGFDGREKKFYIESGIRVGLDTFKMEIMYDTQVLINAGSYPSLGLLHYKYYLKQENNPFCILNWDLNFVNEKKFNETFSDRIFELSLYSKTDTTSFIVTFNTFKIDSIEFICLGSVKRRKDSMAIGDKPQLNWGIINDPDGYTNLRDRKGVNSKILTEVLESELFVFNPDSLSEWWNVHLIRNGYDYHGFIHKSRIKPLVLISDSQRVKLLNKY
ncbi:MAG: hypothetical protein ACP5D9_15365 [Mariniphaga sp.]